MLPPWVADKIELAGYSLSNFFSDFSWERSNYICPDDVNRNGVKEVQYPENSNVAKQKAEELITRVASTLSTEDIIDIGLWHYLFSEALHTINRYNGLATDSQNKFLERARNKSMSSWGNNGSWFTFGEVRVNNAPWNENLYVNGPGADVPAITTEFDEVDYELDTLSCSMKVFGHLFSFTPIKGKDYRDVVRHGLARVHGVSEGGIHGRVKRQGDVVSFGTAGASTIIVPSLATVLNVATLLSPIYFDTEDANSGYAARLDVSEAVEATIKEQIVVFMEEVLSELRRFRDNQEIARSGLLLMYSRLI